ncbi:BREX-1 system adenine-specific DNA-methyltransferase PglX [Fontibacter flavus]|uniref:site-specific DNA-methyltransferase (adenine-specific) n=1 Tax=Fontibacter flavus TaxID=654838 RepID=A0ABV6FVH3_9BACT
MNTNNLKKFAQGARKKLLEQVSAKLDYVLSHDSSTLRTKTETLKRLNDELASMGKDTLVDKVAYTWFNRLVALRFMDANGFQPMGINVITPISGISPQILEEAHAGHIPEELPIRREEVMDILDGRVFSVNPDNDAYRILLVASCNQLSSIFPFLFEKINDYTELLLPDDLTSSFSIIKDILNGMSDEDCQEVEIIGWLYQFYISEKKDEVFASGEKVKKEDIPAATQLFTPRWIVEYMVQNTLGKLWLQNKPNSKLRDYMPYYIESPSAQSDDYLKVNSVEEITLLDQASGSGHILVYGFELFSKIYEEEGYASSEIPQLIIEKNLFGFEIDERAAQLAGFALMMKARFYHRRFFRKEVKPNILHFQDLKLAEEEIKPLFKDLRISISDELFHDLKTMKQATNFGSLIQPHINTKTLEETKNSFQSKVQGADIFSRPKIENLIQTLDQLILLSRKYHCVVDNPPYMGESKMNKVLGSWVRINYPKSRADLMVCFMERAEGQLLENGMVAMINLPSWMFLSSFEEFRKETIKKFQIDSLVHLGRGIFGSDFGSVTFTMKKTSGIKSDGIYRRLFKNHVKVRSVEKIESLYLDKSFGIYKINQDKFKSIAGSPIAYWASKRVQEIFSESQKLIEVGDTFQGIITGNNDLFLRLWQEVSLEKINFNAREFNGIDVDFQNWIPYNKGGKFRKWYGNQDYILNWKNKGSDLTRGKNSFSNYFFKEYMTWTYISASTIATRYFPPGFLWDVSGSGVFPKSQEDIFYFQSLIASNVGLMILKMINPTINFQVENIAVIPIIYPNTDSLKKEIINLVFENIEISKLEWDSREISWNFSTNYLVNKKVSLVEEALDLYKSFWEIKFKTLFNNEVTINRMFIEIYGLEEEVGPEIPLEDITILKEESYIENNNLTFNSFEIISQLVSYFVGCLFGRFSLNKEGLLLANQGDSLDNFFKKVGVESMSFLPDEDNIIPVLDDVWFEDDIVSRFHEFLRVSFEEKNFRKNLAFVEECLGKDIRKYFVKDFYKDHVKRYNKRPIYWSFSSPKGHFNALIYMHRYTPDTLNQILNNYLREFIEKLQAQRKNLLHVEVTGTPAEQNKARKDIIKLDEMIADCRQYETDILYPLATERISIDLDDGVLVNYNKFGKAVTEVQGLNDKKTKDKVKKFDWIDMSTIR